MLTDLQMAFNELKAKSDEFVAKIHDYSLSYDKRIKIAEKGDPLSNFLLSELNKMFYNNDKNVFDVESFLSFSKKAYSNKNLTVADRSFFTSAFYDVLKKEAGEYDKMGKGASYSDELKKTIKGNMNTISSMLQSVDFECMNK